MKAQKRPIFGLFVLLAMLLSACRGKLPISRIQQAETENTKPPPSAASTSLPTDIVTPIPTHTLQTPQEEVTLESTGELQEEEAEDPNPEEDRVDPEPDSLEAVGPEEYPEGINPLTGLMAEDPDLLDLPPALISISNFPASARPQAGLGSSPITFELAIGEGMTRFLAMFYGDFPEAVSGQTEGGTHSEGSSTDSSGDKEGSGSDEGEPASIGPIRSGRLPYEDVRSLYTGFLVMASAWEGVTTQLSETTSVYGSDGDDINSALVGVDKLKQIAQAQAGDYSHSEFNLEGMKFSQTPPEGGRTAHQLWVFYSMLNQIQWRYNEDLGGYIRYDIKTDGSCEFVMSTDRLTGDPVSKENVVVIYAEHDYRAPTLIDINLINRPPTKALLFRDGQVYEIYWTTRFGDYEQETGLMRPMRFVDAEGNTVPFRHGQTWVQIVSDSSYHKESAVSDQPFHPVIEQPGSGLWLVRYKGKY